jgi:serine protease AprX
MRAAAIAASAALLGILPQAHGAPQAPGCEELAASLDEGGAAAREFVVRARGTNADSAADAAVAAARRRGGVVLRRLPLVGGAIARLPVLSACLLDDEAEVVVTPNVAAGNEGAPDPTRLATSYPFTAGAAAAWTTYGATGRGVSVAVVDSGVARTPDLGGRVTHVAVNPSYGVGDRYGHGTHVAGVIAGRDPLGRYVGIAPDARIIDVKVLDRDGTGDLGTVLAGLQWVSDHAAERNIRVVNLSIGTSEPLRYVQHPLNAAVEALWRQGIAVVAAGGNREAGTGILSSPPGNDPFVFTAGGMDDAGTRSTGDDGVASFTVAGLTMDGIAKPDLLAPAVSVRATLAPGSLFMVLHRGAVSGRTLSMSGTSVASAVVSGVAAGVLGRRPELSPDLLKAYLVRAARPLDGRVVVDEAAALSDPRPIEPANQGLLPAPSIDGLWGDAESQASWARASWARASWARASWARASWDSAGESP